MDILIGFGVIAVIVILACVLAKFFGPQDGDNQCL